MKTRRKLSLVAPPAVAPAPRPDPDRIDLMPAELEGFAALRAQEVALARRISDCASAALKARGVSPESTYDGVRDPNTGQIVAFTRKKE